MKYVETRQIRLGSICIGGGAPVVVQSMTNTDTRDAEATLAQIMRLFSNGCEIARLAVPDMEAAKRLREINSASPIPLIADIHFDYRLAITAIEEGYGGIRINPGNIGGRDKVNRVIDAAKQAGTVIRIGVNSGSLEKDILGQYGHPTPQAMVESALRHIRYMEDRGFDRLKISLKSSSVADTVDSYRLMSQVCTYPLHLGVTEAGGVRSGTVKSSVGLGILLHEGIGDTLRVSLTADPEEEVRVAWEILRATGRRSRGPEIISCPTCGRTEIDLFTLAKAVEDALVGCEANIKIAVMGCVVNGPGEAREADLGVAGGKDKGIIFRKGQIVKSVKGNDNLLPAFLGELQKLLADLEQ